MVSSILAVGVLSLCSAYSPSVRNAPNNDLPGTFFGPTLGSPIEEGKPYNSIVYPGGLNAGYAYGLVHIVANYNEISLNVQQDTLDIYLSTYYDISAQLTLPYLFVSVESANASLLNDWFDTCLLYGYGSTPDDYTFSYITPTSREYPELYAYNFGQMYGFVCERPQFICGFPFRVADMVLRDYTPYCWYIDSFYRYGMGYDQGLAYGNQTAYSNGFNDGQSYGYQQGYDVGVSENSPAYISNLITSIVDVPINILNGLSPFVLWNVPLVSIILSVLVIAVILIIVRKFV